MSFYNFMKENVEQVSSANGEGFLIYKKGWEDHREELDQLWREGRVKYENIDGVMMIVLGQWRLVTKWYGQSLPDEDLIELSLQRYSSVTQHDIRCAFECFKQSRQLKKVSASVYRKCLDYWQRFSIEAVAEGVLTYINLGDHVRYDEKYCAGIIRKQDKRAKLSAQQEHSIPLSSVQRQVRLNQLPDAAKQQVEVAKRVREEFLHQGGLELIPEEASELLKRIKQQQGSERPVV